MSSIRNVAIIAHVDHGKTTLVDTLLKQSHTNLGKLAGQDLIMDSDELERERGITIFSKNAAVEYKGTKINIIDTPGHADFGGEVERVLNMADGALLLVDAQEGPMPQTRFVLKKALELGLKIIVIINKIDKPHARINYALEKVIELFMELNASNEQLNFPIVYAAGKLGKAGLSADLSAMQDVSPIFDTIIKHIPPPKFNTHEPLQMMVVSFSYDNFKGRIGVGRIYRGKIASKQKIARISPDGTVTNATVSNLMTFMGLSRLDAEVLEAGDIAAVAGVPDLSIGDTISDPDMPEALPPITVETPTVKMIFSVNNSPFAGREGQYCTSRNLKERLMKELDHDVALRVVQGATPDEFVVSGRGELHLAILIEKMRREGYELQVSRPEVIMKEENGKMLEPSEDAWIDVPESYSGLVIEKMALRKGELKNMHVENNTAAFHFFVPTRGLIGFRSEFVVETKGTGVLNTLFGAYVPHLGDIPGTPHGSLMAHEPGVSTAYGLLNAQERGRLFVGPAVQVYEGQIVGQNAKAEDIVVNVCKSKHLSNFRAKNEAVTDDLTPARILTLEEALEYISDDELVEVTPKSIRLRKKILKNTLRR